MGSFGKHDDVETAGGGRIVVIADNVAFSGPGEKLTANARPYADFKRGKYSLPGGSGGYIYVKTSNENKNNTLDEESSISAQGGLGIGDNAGGSGGVVVFDETFHLSSRNVKVNGGKADEFNTTGSSDGCKNGGSGTVYYM